MRHIFQTAFHQSGSYASHAGDHVELWYWLMCVLPGNNIGTQGLKEVLNDAARGMQA
jgi:hypothetical protein